MTGSVRAFIAVAVPQPILAALRDAQAVLRRSGLKMRWVPAENIHLTLKFLGDIPLTDVDGIRGVMAESAARYTPFSLCVKGMGVFPGIRKPRILWMGIGGERTTLMALHKTMETGLACIGFPEEARPFKSHLTLGRIKGRTEARKLGDAIRQFDGYASEPFAVDRIHLVKSDLKTAGAEYTRLFSTGLAR